MSQMKTGPKVFLIVAGLAGAVFGAKWYITTHGDAKMKSAVPEKSGELSDFKESQSASNAPGAANIPLPGTSSAQMEQPRVKMLILAWNAQMGLALANGGPTTTEGSLMQKHGVNLEIERQDDYGKMQESLAACATELSKGRKRCTNGATFAAIMGDGGPAFLAGLNDTLGKLGPEYKAEIVGGVGRSYGEDKFMAPPNVKSSPLNARGLLVAGVLKDGDWNIAMFWAAENQVCNNPDVTTYDPNCLNWVGTSSFVEADDKYIQSYCEDRPVVKDGKKTGETKRICVNGVVTWTPGDVAVAKKKGGLVPILSTRENSSQMPQVIIGIRTWDDQNRESVKGILKASLEAGDQIKCGGQPVLMRAAAASAKIYKEETAAYWAKYYRGVEEEDAQGNLVPLGGSRVFNLADAMRYFGLEDGSADAFKATYTTFGDIAKQQYPKDLPTYPPVNEVVNTSYLQEIAAGGADKGKADTVAFDDAPATSERLAKKSWHITFETGKAAFSKGAGKDLDQLLSVLVVANDTVVEIHGHTDNVGTPDRNMKLSEDRAFAVKTYLEKKAPQNFPQGRLKVSAHGQTEPVTSNASAEGRAQNRRVDIVLKSNR